MEIRKVRKDEYASVHRMIADIMKNEFGEDLRTHPLQDLEDINASYGGLGEAFFVIAEDNQIVGTIGVKREDDRTAFLRRIFVSPQFRRRQYGSKLIDRAIDFCREVGYQEIVFKTTSNMLAAIKLCHSKGFIERARIDLGGLELFKYTLFLRENSPLHK